MNGREKCEIINQVRRKVAENNNIDFVIYDCTFTGECQGRCAKSDSELHYLEGELEKRQSEGVKLNLEGVFALGGEVKKYISPEERLEKQEKLMENPELKDLPPRYLDMLIR